MYVLNFVCTIKVAYIHDSSSNSLNMIIMMFTILTGIANEQYQSKGVKRGGLKSLISNYMALTKPAGYNLNLNNKGYLYDDHLNDYYYY